MPAVPAPNDRLRLRVLAELSPEQQAAVEAFEAAFGVDVLASDRPLRAMVQDAAMGHLYDHYRASGMSSLDAAYMAGDEVGLSPSAARTRYYRSMRPEQDAA